MSTNKLFCKETKLCNDFHCHVHMGLKPIGPKTVMGLCLISQQAFGYCKFHSAISFVTNITYKFWTMQH